MWNDSNKNIFILKISFIISVEPEKEAKENKKSDNLILKWKILSSEWFIRLITVSQIFLYIFVLCSFWRLKITV